MSRQRLTRIRLITVASAVATALVSTLGSRWATRALAHGARHLAGPVWLRLTSNSGISFSIGAHWSLTTVLEAIVALVVIGAAWYARGTLAAVGFGLLTGGGIANTLARLASPSGRVSDFIAVGSFPVFNVADVAVTLGAAALIVEVLRGHQLVGRS
ncbi:MAG: signal peptidase II [Acidimicrobiales bacterium]